MLLIGLGYCSHRFHLDLLFQWKKICNSLF